MTDFSKYPWNQTNLKRKTDTLVLKVKVLVAQLCPTLCEAIDCSPARLLSPWDSPGKNTGVGCHFLPWGNFLTQGSNSCLLHYGQMLCCLSQQGSPLVLKLLSIWWGSIATCFSHSLFVLALILSHKLQCFLSKGACIEVRHCSSVQSLCCIWLFAMDCSTAGLRVHHQLPELAQTPVLQVGDAIQPSHPLSSPSSPAFSLSQHQGLFQGVSSLHQVAKVLELQLQHQSFQWSLGTDFL